MLNKTDSAQSEVSLTEIVKLDSDFVRAARVGDFARHDDTTIPTVTPGIASSQSRIATAIANDGEKAWSIVGPYGAGKSTFGLILAKLFSSRAGGNGPVTCLSKSGS
jgi:ABC-type multidrug transport system fused ATPase/permease subunit